MATQKASAHRSSPHRGQRVILEHIEQWERQGVLDHQEAEAIRAFETGEVAQAGPVRRVPLVTEALGYLGAALAFAAGAVLVGQRWAELTRSNRLAIAVAAAAILVAAGWPLRRSDEPAMRRFAGTLWALSTVAVAGAFAEALFDVPHEDRANWALFALGLGTAVYARVLHVLRPCTPLQLSLYAATLLTIGGAGMWAIEAGWTWLERTETSWFGVAMLALSLLWMIGGRTCAIEPAGPAVVIGTIGALYAPTLATLPSLGFGLVVGMVTSAVLLAVGVALRNVPVLAMAGLGLFGYLTATIVRYLSDTVGTPIALLVCGLALVGIAVLTARLKRFAG